MKSLIILAILAFQFNCLQTKKSSFDLKQGGVPGLLIFGVSSGLISLGGSTSTDKTAPTVTVTNLKTKGTIETGILMGTSTDNVSVSKVEVQLNTGSFQTATGTTSWTYKLPLTGWTGGNTNTINIKVTDTSGNIGTATLSTLTKGLNKDVNGDGYADLVVSALAYNGGQGRVYIFNGSASGITSTSAASANRTLTGTGTEKFGYGIVLSDFNGDGYSDLAVCAYNSPATNNKAYIYNGSASGISSTGLTLNPVTGANEFCVSMAAGDFNGDGYADLAVPNITGSGTMYVWLGSSNGLTASPSSNFVPGGSNGGMRMASGDINNDGYSDLVTSDSGGSQLYLYRGNSSGINSTPVQNFAVSGFSSYSNAVDLQDVTGDGKIDFILGIPTDSSNVGKLVVHNGNGSTLSTSANTVITGGGGGGAGLCKFGNTLSFSDINDDGINDIIVGSLQYNNGGSNNGKVHLFYGGSLSSGSADTVNSGYIYGETANPNWSSQFGSFISVRDFNGDGIKDIAVGASALSSVKGGTYIFSNASTAFTSTSATSKTTLIVGENVNDAFGSGGY